MSRPLGRLNHDHDAAREALALALVPTLTGRLGALASMRELALAAGVSVPTLTHYFGDKHGVWRAAVGAVGRRGAAHVAAAATPDPGPAGPSMRRFVHNFVLAWTQFGVGDTFRAGLQLGLHADRVGPAFLDAMLEPTLQAAEARLSAHVARGDVDPLDVRAAALALVSPVVLGLLHQGALGGAACRPLEMAGFLEAHLTAWERGWLGPRGGNDASAWRSQSRR